MYSTLTLETLQINIMFLWSLKLLWDNVCSVLFWICCLIKSGFFSNRKKLYFKTRILKDWDVIGEKRVSGKNVEKILELKSKNHESTVCFRIFDFTLELTY